MTLSTILSTGLLATAMQAAGTTAQPDWADLIADLNTRLETAEANDEFAGAILVAVGEEVLYTDAFGLAHRGHGVANRVDTKFNLGSIDKQFTMAAIMRLVEAGEIDLDANVATYLPDYPNRDVAENVTVRHLLTHTSGMGFYWTEDLFREIGRFRTLQDFADLFADEALAFRPGEGWAYSNNGYIVLGLIIEAVTGEDYHEHVRRVVFDPLDMENTGPFAVDEVTPNLATGYTRMSALDVLDEEFDPGAAEGRDVWYANYYTHPPRGGSAGGGYSTVEDLFDFTRALREGGLISQASYEMVSQPYNRAFEDPDSEAFYGYAMQVMSPGSETEHVGHTGGGTGNGAVAFYYPAYDLTAIWLTNQEGSVPVPARVLRDFFEAHGER